MAAVLFRRLLSNIDDFPGTVPAQVQDVCKSQLIEAAHKEQDESMRKKISDSIAELAKCYLGKEIQFFKIYFLFPLPFPIFLLLQL